MELAGMTGGVPSRGDFSAFGGLNEPVDGTLVGRGHCLAARKNGKVCGSGLGWRKSGCGACQFGSDRPGLPTGWASRQIEKPVVPGSGESSLGFGDRRESPFRARTGPVERSMNSNVQDLSKRIGLGLRGVGSARRLFPLEHVMDSVVTPFSSASPSATPRRLNLLFSATWREGGPTAELPRLLDPLGVRCLEARCGRDAAR